jgi:hypothetical protein
MNKKHELLTEAEIESRFEKVSSAVCAIEHIIEMLRPSAADALYVAGCTMAFALYKGANPQELDDVMAKLCDHANRLYNELHAANAAKESQKTELKH